MSIGRMREGETQTEGEEIKKGEGKTVVELGRSYTTVISARSSDLFIVFHINSKGQTRTKPSVP